MIDEGICLNKEGNTSAKNIYKINNLDIEESSDHDLSFLAKVAKGGCFEKNNLVMDYMAEARSIFCKNKFLSIEETMNTKKGRKKKKRTELTAQQKELLAMIDELTKVSRDSH